MAGHRIEEDCSGGVHGRWPRPRGSQPLRFEFLPVSADKSPLAVRGLDTLFGYLEPSSSVRA